MIYSYNNKWFFIILVFVLFIKPRWILYYLMAIFAIQFYMYYGSVHFPECGLAQDLKFVELIDNLIFFLIGYLILHLLFSFLKSKNQRLDNSKDLLSYRTEQLMQSNQELEKFAYIASHDLKSPLRNIISFTMLLEKELQGNATQKQEEYLSYIKKGSAKLNNLVDDVLSFSKATDNSIESLEKVDCNKIVLEIKELLRESLLEKNAQILTPLKLPAIESQRTMILLLFKNLIENGIKYNESDQPTVSITYEPGIVPSEIKFQDNGIGIQEKFHHTIFDMFSRLHAENQYEGTGLGLSLCKKIMNNLNGNINLDSEPGNGTTFSLIFPSSILKKL